MYKYSLQKIFEKFHTKNAAINLDPVTIREAFGGMVHHANK